MGNRESLKGSADSLGLDLHEELLKFHEKYYSSDLMKLVVCGNQSLDQLTKWVAEKFSEIQRKDDARAICSGWATDVAAETDSLLCSNFNHLYIDITATPLGLQNYKEIVRALFVYLQQITKDGPSERYYNELCIIKKLKFENYEKKAQAPWVLKLAEAIHNRYILPEDVISSNDLLGPFDSS
ncbi:metalloprotease, partial [Coemansia sp. RSA 2598]